MPHKITLTGIPTSALRVNGTLLSFDMEESGSNAAPKGLPVSKEITYTVFLNTKQLKKAGLDEKNIAGQKLLVQGEPTLDMPIDQCPGEIGVICFQLSVVPEKKEESKPEESVKQEIQQALEQVAVVVEEKVEPVPEGTEDMIPLESIIVPEGFLLFKPNEQKTQVVIDFVKENGHLDEPITVNKTTLELIDGYRRYVVAQRLKMEQVPVIYEKYVGRKSKSKK
jgi:hypothetical protein